MVRHFSKAINEILALILRIEYFLEICSKTFCSLILLIPLSYAVDTVTYLVTFFNFVTSSSFNCLIMGNAEFLIPFRVFNE